MSALASDKEIQQILFLRAVSSYCIWIVMGRKLAVCGLPYNYTMHYTTARLTMEYDYHAVYSCLGQKSVEASFQVPWR